MIITLSSLTALCATENSDVVDTWQANHSQSSLKFFSNHAFGKSRLSMQPTTPSPEGLLYVSADYQNPAQQFSLSIYRQIESDPPKAVAQARAVFTSIPEENDVSLCTVYFKHYTQDSSQEFEKNFKED